jgi:phenylpropionate dioxygenase-like ring-hydroxylating dioxygenase large terminal subunit
MSEGLLTDNPALDGYWYAVSTADEVSPGPIGVGLLGLRYVVWRGDDGDLVVAPDRCTHREAQLSRGRVVDGCIECPYHGWRFGLEGRCVLVPSSGPDAAIPPKAHLPTVNVTEKYGLVWLCPGEPVADVPLIVQDDDPAFRRLNTATQHWSTSTTRMVDNFLDISHFPFVHVGTFGIAQETEVPRIEITGLDSGYTGYEYEVLVRNDEAGQAVSGLVAPTLQRKMSTGFVLPTTIRSTILYETGLEHIILLLSTPVDDVTSTFIFVVWRNDDFSVPADDILSFDLAIGAEDQLMLETMAGVLPMDQTATVSVQSDRPSVEWRRQFAALLAGD